MSRKSKKKEQAEQTAAKGRLVVDDDAYRPFKDVKLQEAKQPQQQNQQKNQVKKEQNKNQNTKANPGLVIGDFDKNADFGDILAAWTGGQDPDKVRHDAIPSKVDDKRSFADIFADWEQSQGITPKHKKKEVKIKKSTPYQQTVDFGDILSKYEGKPKQQPKKQTEQPKQQQQEQPKHDPNLKLQKSTVQVSGKDFGEILRQFNGEQPKPKQPAEPKQQEATKHDPKVKLQKSTVQASGKDFGEILRQFNGEKEEPQPEPKQVKEEKKQENQEPKPMQKSEVKTSGKEFGEILDSYEDNKLKEEHPVAWSFADIYKKWDKTSDEAKAIQKSKETKQEKDTPELSISDLRSMQPQVTLDLHGYKAEDAAKATRNFLEDSVSHNLRKICLIPGKGIHNENGVSVLKDVVLSEIRLSGLVREAYSPKACYGGSGVIWVILKEKNS